MKGRRTRMALRKTLVVLLAVLTLSVGLLAVDVPTGNVLISYGPAPCGGTKTPITTVTLDVNGGYSLPSQGGSFHAGEQWAFYADYQGDASHAPSSSCVVVNVVSPLTQTVTTVMANPNPLQVGQLTTISGSVADQ
jgi:hypothetical protein